MMSTWNWNETLRELFLDALTTVTGKVAVSKTLREHPDFAPTMVAAVGKAAVEMYGGCRTRFPDARAIVVSKYGHGIPAGSNVEFLEAAHPIPDDNSLRAGDALAAWIEGAQPEDRLLMLVSGGASSLVEKLIPGKTLEDLRAMTSAAMCDGSTIEQLNARRVGLSEIKGGKLLGRFPGWEIVVLAISDVASDGIDLIGSGIGDRGSYQNGYMAKLVASNNILRSELARRFGRIGLTVVANEETLSMPVDDVVRSSIDMADRGGRGVYIFGGEPTIVLPDKPGIGGRAQALALMFAKAIGGRTDLHILVSGTDGSDGVSDATGAVVDGTTFGNLDDADDYLRRADSGTYFGKTGDAIVTGPTGTNVADIAVLIRE
jgi:glycerate 2-kinase